MAAKDIFQTHKEFKERNKRLKIKQSYEELENIKLNEIADIDEEIEKLKSLIAKKKEEYNEISLEKLKELSKEYNDKDLINRIIELAKYTTYSHSNIEDIKNLCATGINTDNTDWDLIEKITLAEESINDEIRHTNYVSDILNDFGNNINLPNGKDGG